MSRSKTVEVTVHKKDGTTVIYDVPRAPKRQEDRATARVGSGR